MFFAVVFQNQIHKTFERFTYISTASKENNFPLFGVCQNRIVQNRLQFTELNVAPGHRFCFGVHTVLLFAHIGKIQQRLGVTNRYESCIHSELRFRNVDFVEQTVDHIHLFGFLFQLSTKYFFGNINR